MHKNSYAVLICRSFISSIIVLSLFSGISGSAIVQTRAATNYPNVQQAQLTATSYPDGAIRVAISGNTIAAGSSDQVDIFIRNAASWVRQATLQPSRTKPVEIKGSNTTGGSDAGVFGSYEIALDRDTLLIPGHRQNVHVFTRSGTNWTEQPSILPPVDLSVYDEFGFSVALDGDTAVIGVPNSSNGGTAYIYVRTGNSWTIQAKLRSTGSFLEGFGVGVAISGDSVLVGTDGNWPDTSKVYVFVRNGTTWSQQAILSSPAGGTYTTALALSGDTALVGWSDADNGLGKAYAWKRTGDTWTVQGELVPDERGIRNYFAISVALDGDVAAVGSRRHLADIGDIRVFTRSGGGWTQQARLIPNDYLPTRPESKSAVSIKIALSGTTLISGVGNPVDSVYVFDSGTPTVYPRSYVGVYRPSTGVFYLRNSNRWDQGSSIAPIVYGDSSYLPVTGDWNGDGIDTIGAYSKITGVFHLRDSNSAGVPDHLVVFGNPGDQPLAGRWDSAMSGDGVGVFRPSAGVVFLRRGVTDGPADYGIVLGFPGDVGIAGDWDGDGVDSFGYYGYRNFAERPWRFYLSNSTGSQAADYDLSLQETPTGIPFAGDFGAIGRTGVGIYSDAGWMLMANLTQTHQYAYPDNIILFGNPGDVPVSGHWFADVNPATAGREPTAPRGILVLPGSGGTRAPSTEVSPAYGDDTAIGMD